MFYSPKLYLRDKWVLLPLIFIVLAQIIMWWYLAKNIKPGADQIFLHYNVVFGIDLLGAWWKIYLLPAGGLLTFLVNYFLSFLFYSFDRTLSRFLSFLTLPLQIFLLIAVFYITGLNI